MKRYVDVTKRGKRAIDGECLINVNYALRGQCIQKAHSC